MKFHLNLISSICFQFKLKRTFERNIVQIVDGTLVPLGKYPFIVVVEKYEGGDYNSQTLFGPFCNDRVENNRRRCRQEYFFLCFFSLKSYFTSKYMQIHTPTKKLNEYFVFGLPSGKKIYQFNHYTQIRLISLKKTNMKKSFEFYL